MNMRLEKNGSITLPQEVRAALGVTSGDELTFVPCEDGFKLIRLVDSTASLNMQDQNTLSTKPGGTDGFKEAIAKKTCRPRYGSSKELGRNSPSCCPNEG